jgi:hypothetical protein
VTISVTGTLERPATRDLRVLEFLSMDGPIDVGSRLPKYFDLIGRVRHQAAGLNENTKRVDRRQAVARRQRNDLVAIENQHSIRRQEQATVRHASEISNCLLDVAGGFNPGRRDRAQRRLDNRPAADP